MTGPGTLTVDQDLCMGSGYCARAHPDLFGIGDDGIAFARSGQLSDGQQLLDADHAAGICPASAVEVRRGGWARRAPSR